MTSIGIVLYAIAWFLVLKGWIIGIRHLTLKGVDWRKRAGTNGVLGAALMIPAVMFLLSGNIPYSWYEHTELLKWVWFAPMAGTFAYCGWLWLSTCKYFK